MTVIEVHPSRTSPCRSCRIRFGEAGEPNLGGAALQAALSQGSDRPDGFRRRSPGPRICWRSASRLASIASRFSKPPSVCPNWASRGGRRTACQPPPISTALRNRAAPGVRSRHGRRSRPVVLGLLYYPRPGVPRIQGSMRWFRQAADRDDVAAQFYLGVMFSKGRGVPQDKAEAVKWFRRAADQGDAQAQYNLGLSYAKGEAGEPDNVSAHMWFNLAAAHFPASDADDRGAAVRNRDLVAEKMTPDQIARAQRRAREWKSESH